MNTPANDGATPERVGNCKLGEFIRLKVDAKQTYKRGHYCRSQKKFCLVNCDDVNRWVFRSRNTVVFIGFTY